MDDGDFPVEEMIDELANSNDDVPEEEYASIGVPKHLLEAINSAPSGVAILATCVDLAYFLAQKNISYGDSAINPVRVFSKAPPQEQILVRMDDKLNRLLKGVDYADEDTLKDLLGYLLLYFVAKDVWSD